MKLAKESIVFKAIQKFGTLTILILFSGGLSVASFNPLVIFGFLSAALVLISAILVWEYLVWKNYDFFFGDDNLNIKHGVISKKHREIPLSRIQNVDIQRNIFQRLLGVAQVDLETAGGNTTEASLKYVYLETGRAIQRKFRDLEKNLKTDEEEKRELLFELEPKELFLLGVTSVNTGMFFGILALLGLGGGFLIDAAESSGIGLVTGLTVFIFFSAIATWTGSIINNVLKYFDFRLYQVEDSLEYERGLLKRSEGSIPLEKIQKLTIEENPLKRLFGYSTLKIETAGYSAEQSVQQGAEAAIPLAKKNRTVEFGKMIQEFESFELNSIPKRARTRYFGRYSILIGLVLFGGSIYSRFFSFNHWLILLFLPIAGIAAHYKWKNKAYFAGENHFVSMNGFWNRKTMVTPYYRIQNLIETQTFLQRRWNLSSLTLDIAGTNHFQKDAKVSDLDTEDTNKLREKVFIRFQKAISR